MDLKDQLVAHRKIDIDNTAIFEMHRPERCVVDLCRIKIAKTKSTIDEGNADEVACAEIAVSESAALEFLQIHVIPAEYFAVIMGFCEIFSHLRGFTKIKEIIFHFTK
jgi:hypothetical protein